MPQTVINPNVKAQMRKQRAREKAKKPVDTSTFALADAKPNPGGRGAKDVFPHPANKKWDQEYGPGDNQIAPDPEEVDVNYPYPGKDVPFKKRKKD